MFKPIVLTILITTAWMVSAQEAADSETAADSNTDTTNVDTTDVDTAEADTDSAAANIDDVDTGTSEESQQPAAENVSDNADQLTTEVAGDATEQIDQAGAAAVEQADQVSTEAAEQVDQADAAAPAERRKVRRLGDVVNDTGDEWVLDIPQGLNIQRQPSINVQVPDAQLNNQLQQVLTDQANNPNDQAIASQLEAVIVTIEQRADDNLVAGNIPLAAAYLDAINTLEADRAGLSDRQLQLQDLRQVQTLQAQLDQAFTDDRLLQPEEDNALFYLNQILTIDADNAQALSSRDELQQRLMDRVDGMAANLDFEQADALLEQVVTMNPDMDIDIARQTMADQRQAHAADLEAQARTALDAGNLDQAEQLLNELIALGSAEAATETLRKSIADVRQYGGLEPGQVFQDSYAGGSAQAPVMVVLPAGSFMMGSPESEENRRDSENPRFRVSFARGFALSQREVSVAEFRRFIQSTGYRTEAERLRESSYYDEDTGRLAQGAMTWENDFSGGRADDDLPVLHISWNDANAYVQWLSDVTQRAYRLPSEAEMEYAIRGGTQTVYWWGDDSPPSDEVENVTGEGDISESRRRWNDSFENYEDGHWGPAPVGSMRANPFGLFDINGNVKEWTADCWHVNYTRAPVDGSAWVNPGCESRVVRGADWSSTPAQSRSALRISARNQTRGPRVGIRLARDL